MTMPAADPTPPDVDGPTPPDIDGPAPPDPVSAVADLLSGAGSLPLPQRTVLLQEAHRVLQDALGTLDRA